MIPIETGTGKTRFFRDVISYIEYTEMGFQKIVADNTGSTIDPASSRIEMGANGDIEIDGLPELPQAEWKPERKMKKKK